MNLNEIVLSQFSLNKYKLNFQEEKTGKFLAYLLRAYWRCAPEFVGHRTEGLLRKSSIFAFLETSKNLQIFSVMVTYGKGLLINMQKLVFGVYRPDFSS